eukprot:COSAG06_NODE_75432_length_131_cov_38.218750_1_plen_25_part_10
MVVGWFGVGCVLYRSGASLRSRLKW